MNDIIESNYRNEYSVNDLVKNLLDIYSYERPLRDYFLLFDEIATGLLRQTKIVTPNNHFYIREIEFYFFDQINHPDPYAHKNKRQFEFGEWYFHRFSNIDSFMRTNRNGLDITFGNKASNVFGGILIRKIQNIRTQELIVGINRVAKELIKNVGLENINEIALSLGQRAFKKDGLLHLEVEGNNYSAPIYKSQRNGLTYYEDEVSKQFFKIPYCYFNHNLNLSEVILVSPSV